MMQGDAPGRSGEATADASPAATAVVLIHGMGDQGKNGMRDALVDVLVINQLAEPPRENERPVEQPPTVELPDPSGPAKGVRLFFLDCAGRRRGKVDLFEAYWAPLTRNKTNLASLLGWLGVLSFLPIEKLRGRWPAVGWLGWLLLAGAAFGTLWSLSQFDSAAFGWAVFWSVVIAIALLYSVYALLSVLVQRSPKWRNAYTVALGAAVFGGISLVVLSLTRFATWPPKEWPALALIGAVVVGFLGSRILMGWKTWLDIAFTLTFFTIGIVALAAAGKLLLVSENELAKWEQKEKNKAGDLVNWSQWRQETLSLKNHYATHRESVKIREVLQLLGKPPQRPADALGTSELLAHVVSKAPVGLLFLFLTVFLAFQALYRLVDGMRLFKAWAIRLLAKWNAFREGAVAPSGSSPLPSWRSWPYTPVSRMRLFRARLVRPLFVRRVIREADVAAPGRQPPTVWRWAGSLGLATVFAELSHLSNAMLPSAAVAFVWAFLVFRLLLLAQRYWLVEFLGDVEVYMTTHETSQKFAARKEILNVTTTLVNEVALRYRRVVILGHSLGSVIGMDTLRRLHSEGQLPASVDLFITFGSPLLKTRMIVERENPGVAADRVRAFHVNLRNIFTNRRWLNFWYGNDIVSDGLCEHSEYTAATIDGRPVSRAQGNPDNHYPVTADTLLPCRWAKPWTHSDYIQDPVFLKAVVHEL